MTSSEAARALAIEGAEQRRFRTREPILATARAMREAIGLPPAPALTPPLILSRADRA